MNLKGAAMKNSSIYHWVVKISAFGLMFAITTIGLRLPRAQAQSAAKKPNILVIFGDDIGIPQVSAYSQGMMGYKTPNIDRIAREGALFTDAYGQQSCTA